VSAPYERPLSHERLKIVVRPVLIVAIYLALWEVLAFVALNFKVSFVTVWFPPAGLSLVLLFVFGLRYAPALVLASLIYAALFDEARLEPGYFAIYALVTSVTYAAIYIGAAALLLRKTKINPRLRGQRDVLWFVGVACFSAPLMAALLLVLEYTLAGQLAWSDYAVNTLSFWAGNATGVGMLAPFLLVVLRGFPRVWADPPEETDVGIRRP